MVYSTGATGSKSWQSETSQGHQMSLFCRGLAVICNGDNGFDSRCATPKSPMTIGFLFLIAKAQPLRNREL
jgi:hypothetical protein